MSASPHVSMRAGSTHPVTYAPANSNRARTHRRYMHLKCGTSPFACPPAQPAIYHTCLPVTSSRSSSTSVRASPPLAESQPAACASPPPGFACLPGVSSPTHFRVFWLRVARPRVEKLMRAAADAPTTGSVLLPLLDELVFELKQVAMPALHCSDHHCDAEWRAAGAEVYSACHKYEQYFMRHQGLYRKLCEVHRQLSMLSEQHQRSRGVSSRGGDGSAGDGAADPPGELVGQAHMRSQGLLQDEHELHLAQALLQLFERRGGAAVQDAFSTSHYVLPHLPDTEDPAWQGCMNAVRRERELASRVRSSVASASKSPVLPLVLIDWEVPANEASGRAEDETQAPWSSDPILQPLLRRTPRLHTFMGGSLDQEPGSSEKEQAAAGWGAVLLLDSVAISQVLSHHPNPSLREAVYTAGLEARTDVALHLRTQMADARAAIARANHAPSYAHLMLEPEPMHLSAGSRDNLSQQHQNTRLVKGEQPDSSCSSPRESANLQPVPGRVESVGRLLHACAQAVRGPADEQLEHMAACSFPAPAAASASLNPHQLQPWDVAYAQQQLLHAQGLDVRYEEVKAYLSLEGLVEGLSCVLEQTMGLRIRIQRSTPISGSDTASLRGTLNDADLWAPGVTRLVLESVCSQSCRDAEGAAQPMMLGICYLDPGGGYGTRQLRFARQARSWLSSSQQHRQPGWEKLPVVSVGLQQLWSDGHAGRLEAVVELLHELGHACHLIASSHAAPYKLLGGLHLPLELLEVPSILFERFAMDYRTLQAICRLPSYSQGGARGVSVTLDDTTARRLAAQFKARHSSALDLQEQVLVALGDHILDMSSPMAPDQEASDAGSLFDGLQEAYSSLSQASASLKQLSSLPVASHHQATFWAYICAWCCACGMWESYLGADPLGTTGEGAASGRALRCILLEAGPDRAGSDVNQNSHTSHVGGMLTLAYALKLATPQNLRRWLYHGESRGSRTNV